MKVWTLLFASFICVTLGAEDALRVLCYGDSITAAERGWVSKLGERGNIDALNAGVGGRRATNARKELAPYLDKYGKERLDVIVMCLGVNDLPARDPRPGEEKVALCVQGMREAIELAQERFSSAQIVLVAPCGVNSDTMSEVNLSKGYQITQPLLEHLETSYRALAQEMGVSFFSLLTVVSKENYSDGLHPDDAGHEEIVSALRGYLAERGLIPRRATSSESSR